MTCGQPLPFAVEGVERCGVCEKTSPPFRAARSVFMYDAQTRPLLMRLKHRKDLSLVPLLETLLYRAYTCLPERVDLVVPIPLHWRRLWSRGFNQSAVLAQALATRLELPYDPLCIKRVRATPSQGGLSAEERRQNMRGAFSMCESRCDTVKGKKVLLVDDVYTTGATLSSCAKTLQKAGADSVCALTIARALDKRFFPY